MLNRTHKVTAFAAALAAMLLVPAQASADPPNGTYAFALEDLRVVAGNTDLSQFFPFAFLCSKFKTKGSGKLSGKCSIDLPGSSGLDGKIKGNIEHDEDKTVLTQSLKLDGKINGLGFGRSLDVEHDFKIKSTLKKDETQIKQVTKSKSCIEDSGCEKDSSKTLLPASAFDNLGVILTSAILELDVTTNAKNKIKGKATVTTTEGKKIKLDVKGKHTPGGTSVIKLSKGATSVRLDDADVLGDVMTTVITYKKVFGNAASFLAMSVL